MRGHIILYGKAIDDDTERYLRLSVFLIQLFMGLYVIIVVFSVKSFVSRFYILDEVSSDLNRLS